MSIIKIMHHFSNVESYHGCHYSLDWTTGLEYWTGILDWITGLSYFLFLDKFLYLFLERCSHFLQSTSSWVLWMIVIMTSCSVILLLSNLWDRSQGSTQKAAIACSKVLSYTQRMKRDEFDRN